jgi:hypothetical protein
VSVLCLIVGDLGDSEFGEDDDVEGVELMGDEFGSEGGEGEEDKDEEEDEGGLTQQPLPQHHSLLVGGQSMSSLCSLCANTHCASGLCVGADDGDDEETAAAGRRGGQKGGKGKGLELLGSEDMEDEGGWHRDN